MGEELNLGELLDAIEEVIRYYGRDVPVEVLADNGDTFKIISVNDEDLTDDVDEESRILYLEVLDK